MNYTLTAPSPASGNVNNASGNFTIALGVGDPGGNVVITPASNKAGTFTPTTRTLNNTTRTATFTFTPTAAGTHTISSTNDGSLDNPSSVLYQATTMLYTLSGPEVGNVQTASANFTVTLGTGNPGGTITITPAAAPGTGTFTPTTVNLTNAARSATFTFTPTSPGVYSISTTNSGALDNPTAASYKAVSVFTNLVTVIKNISGAELNLSFIPPHGIKLATGASHTLIGDVQGLIKQGWQDRQYRDFCRAIEGNKIEIITGPATILRDASTGAIKVLTLNNGTLGTSNPLYGSYTDA